MAFRSRHRHCVERHLSFISVSGIRGQTNIVDDAFKEVSFKVAVEIGRHLHQRSAVSSREPKKNCNAETTSLSGREREKNSFFNSCSGLQILLKERPHVSEIYWECGFGINRSDGNNGLKCEAILEAGFCHSTLSFKRMLWETFLARGEKKKCVAVRGSLALHWRRLWSLTRRATHEKVSGCTKGQAGGAISKNTAGMGVSLEKNLPCVSISNWFCTYLLKVRSSEMHFGCISFDLFRANFCKTFSFHWEWYWTAGRSDPLNKQKRKGKDFLFSWVTFSAFSSSRLVKLNWTMGGGGGGGGGGGRLTAGCGGSCWSESVSDLNSVEHERCRFRPVQESWLKRLFPRINMEKKINKKAQHLSRNLNFPLTLSTAGRTGPRLSAVRRHHFTAAVFIYEKRNETWRAR